MNEVQWHPREISEKREEGRKSNLGNWCFVLFFSSDAPFREILGPRKQKGCVCFGQQVGKISRWTDGWSGRHEWTWKLS